MADWSILQQPNFTQAALAGYQAGSAIGRQRRLDSALGGVDLERPETIMPVLQADPSTGAALLGASTKMAQYKHDLAGKAALTNYLLAQKGLTADGGSSGTTNSAVPPDTASPASANAPSPTADSAGPDIVVTGQSPLEQARIALIKADPDTYIKTETAIAGMNEAQRKNLDAANNTFGAAIEATRQMPYEQRKTYIQSIRPQLIAHGVPAQQIDAFDPTDQNIGAVEDQVLGVKGILDKQDKDRSFNETVRQHNIENAQGQQRIGIESENAGIAAGHLALDRQTEARVAKQAQGAAGGIPSPATQSDYAALPAGTRYRAPDGSIRIKR